MSIPDEYTGYTQMYTDQAKDKTSEIQWITFQRTVISRTISASFAVSVSVRYQHDDQSSIILEVARVRRTFIRTVESHYELASSERASSKHVNSKTTIGHLLDIVFADFFLLSDALWVQTPSQDLDCSTARSISLFSLFVYAFQNQKVRLVLE